jgi:hypothetical protein
LNRRRSDRAARRRARLCGACAVVVFVVSMVWHPLASAQGAGPGLRVSVFGDSVLLGARDQLLAQLQPWSVTVDAAEDRSLLGAIDIFQAAQPTLGDVVVLDLGYNDSDDPAVFRGRIDGAMGALAGVQRVVWLNQSEYTAGRARMNAELVAAASRYPNLEVVDWNAEVVAHPEDVYADHIHLTPAGQSAMAAVVRRHIDDYLASRQPAASTTTDAPTSTSVAPLAAPARATSPHGHRAGWARPVVISGAALLAVVALGLLAWAIRRRQATA